MLKTIPAFALGAALLIAGGAIAQQAGTEQNRRQPGEREGRIAERRGANEKDEMFAKCLAIDNAAEIQISEFAAQRLQNEQAKQFAQMMVQDHRAFMEKLQQFGAEPVNFRTTTTNATGAPADVSVRTGQGADVNVDVNRDGNRDGDRETVRERVAERRDDRQDARQNDFVAIKQEIAQECVRSAEEELTSKNGAEADKCYMAAQVFCHQHMLDTLKVLDRHASPELKETLAQASQTTQKHLDQAKQILKSLDNAHAETPAASSGTTR